MPTVQVLPDIVLVDGQPFARWVLEDAEPARDYGCDHVLKTRPVLDGQGTPGWYEQFQRVCASIESHVSRQN